MGDVQHLVEPGGWTTSSEHPRHKILLSNENTHVRTWGNSVWEITQVFLFLLSLVHAGSAACSQEYSEGNFTAFCAYAVMLSKTQSRP